jgi:putative Holliday junction resolvase
MRLLGIDYGTKRVGLALSDSLGLLAHPYATLTRTTRERLFAELSAIIAKEKVQAVVIGLPLGLDGQETEAAKQVRNFAASLARRVNVPIHFENEALSSKAAQDQLRQVRLRGKKQLAALDQQAAVIILSDYLERRQASQR